MTPSSQYKAPPTPSNPLKNIQQGLKCTMDLKLAITDLLALPNSEVKIPQLGFGVYLSPAEKCKTSCLAALKAGYRYIDSAQ
jgi:hypothetical protein